MTILTLPKKYHLDFSSNRKPLRPVEIDWSNSLTRDLRAYYPITSVGGQSARNYAMKTRADRQSGTGGKHVTKDGLVIDPSGSAYYRETLQSMDIASGFTMFVTMRAAGVSGYGISVGNAATNQGPHLGFQTSTNIRFGMWGAVQVNQNVADSTSVYSAVGVYDGATWLLYINGDEKSSTNYSGAVNPTNNYVHLNALPDATVGGLSSWNQGYIDRALSPSDVMCLYRDQNQLLKPAIPMTYHLGAEAPVLAAIPVFNQHYRSQGMM